MAPALWVREYLCVSRQRYGQDPAESQKDDRNNDYKSPAVENEWWKKNIPILKKINLKKLIFKKHLCQNPNLQIFSWRSPFRGGERRTTVFAYLKHEVGQDIPETRIPPIYNSSIWYLFLAKKYNFRKKQTQTILLVLLCHSSSTALALSRSVPHTWSPASALILQRHSLFLLPCSNTAPLTTEPLASSLCNTAWLHVASAARKNPSVATSKKAS